MLASLHRPNHWCGAVKNSRILSPAWVTEAEGPLWHSSDDLLQSTSKEPLPSCLVLQQIGAWPSLLQCERRSLRSTFVHTGNRMGQVPVVFDALHDWDNHRHSEQGIAYSIDCRLSWWECGWRTLQSSCITSHPVDLAIDSDGRSRRRCQKNRGTGLTKGFTGHWGWKYFSLPVFLVDIESERTDVRGTAVGTCEGDRMTWHLVCDSTAY